MSTQSIDGNFGNPKQLKLFDIKEYLMVILNKDFFDSDDVKYYKKGDGSVPPNNPEKYYFGVELSDEEHRELIIILKNPRDVLHFYYNIYKDENLAGELDIFDRDKKTEVVERLLDKKEDIYFSNLEYLVSAILKINSAIKNSAKLRKILDEYGRIEKEVKSQGFEEKRVVEDSSEKKESTKKKVYRKLGGWENVRDQVMSRLKLLLRQNGNDFSYVSESVVTDDFKKSFTREMIGFDNLEPNEKGMAYGLVNWHFNKSLEELATKLNF